MAGSSTAYRQVTNMFGGISAHSRSLARLRTAPGSTRRGASVRRMLWVVAMTMAAGTPLSVTSPTTRPIRPSGSGMKS